MEHNLYSLGSQHENLHQSLVTTNRVTHFIPWAHMGTYISHTYCKEKVWREFVKTVKWTGKAEILLRKKFLAIGKACMAIS